jgi:NAD(P)-dependent dehydrogenase (short-subunit alcohol dehydrogenase family)
MHPDNKSRIGFIRAMAREMLVHNAGISVVEAIELSRELYDQTYNLNHTHTGEDNGTKPNSME